MQIPDRPRVLGRRLPRQGPRPLESRAPSKKPALCRPVFLLRHSWCENSFSSSRCCVCRSSAGPTGSPASRARRRRRLLTILAPFWIELGSAKFHEIFIVDLDSRWPAVAAAAALPFSLFSPALLPCCPLRRPARALQIPPDRHFASAAA